MISICYLDMRKSAIGWCNLVAPIKLSELDDMQEKLVSILYL